MAASVKTRSGALTTDQHHSVDPFSRASSVDNLEGGTGALVEDSFGLEAQVLVITVSSHAGFEDTEVFGAELSEDILAGSTFVLTSEAITSVSMRRESV